jgi:hypothetical protein
MNWKTIPDKETWHIIYALRRIQNCVPKCYSAILPPASNYVCFLHLFYLLQECQNNPFFIVRNKSLLNIRYKRVKTTQTGDWPVAVPLVAWANKSHRNTDT